VTVTQKFAGEMLTAEIPLKVINTSTINHSFTLPIQATNTPIPQTSFTPH